MIDNMKEKNEGRSNANISNMLLDSAVYAVKDRWEEETFGTVGAVPRQISNIVRCMKGIIDSKRTLFKLTRKDLLIPRRHWEMKLDSTLLGKEFLLCLTIHFEDLAREYPIVWSHPYVNLFASVVYRDSQRDARAGMVAKPIGYELCNWTGMRDRLPDGELKILVDRLNDVVREIREEGQAQAFQEQLKRYWRPAVKNYRSLIDLIRAVHGECHHLLVIRLDLSYLKAYGTSISYDEVRRHRIAFQRHLTRCKRLGGVYLGSAIKLERGAEKGLHYHALVFINGDVLHGDIAIANELGEHWNVSITGGKGTHFNCNSQSYGSKRGIGSIRYDDVKTRYNLETRVAAYITKPDFFIYEAKHEDDHTFWRTYPPSERAVRRGRKRSKVDAIAAISAMPLPSRPKRRSRAHAVSAKNREGQQTS
ncbi:inovirus Gp2 family protein [Paraburkholderia bryophila]|uniref:hypothetical protein n=1 Tax=Paraburkholderia bryophila TaxID=420952 RepID=UPI00234B277E|nr:hypothetical protein [Paraburkholderia bryophila]WCM18772.1 inovirus Gp2 family protein [Paraburkholderia bryophila]